MIEFLCGLVGIVVLVSMMLQIRWISVDHTKTVLAARRSIAQSISGTAPIHSAGYLSDWDEGRDRRSYTLDDIARGGDARSFMDGMAICMDLGDLEATMPENRFSDFMYATESSLGGAFDIYRIAKETEPIPILPGVRKLVVDKDFLVIRHEIYMPWINNVLD